MTSNTAVIGSMTGVSDSTNTNVPVEPRSRGPKGIKGWLAYIGLAVLGTELFMVLALLLLAPSGLASLGALVAITVAAFLAGRVAKVSGARWWVFAWIVAFFGTTAVNVIPLLLLSGQVTEILQSTAP